MMLENCTSRKLYSSYEVSRTVQSC
jgi:hypothetical protein